MRVGAALLITSISFVPLMLGSKGSSNRRASTAPADPVIAETAGGVRYGYLGGGSGGPAPTLFVFAGSLEDSLTHPMTRSLAVVTKARELAARNLWIIISHRDERVGTGAAMDLAQTVGRAAASMETGTEVRIHVEPAEGHRVPEGGYRRAAQWFLQLDFPE